MIYSDKVMDHFKNPRNVGEIDDANGVGEVGNAKCGDIMKVYLKVEDNIIKDVKFQVNYTISAYPDKVKDAGTRTGTGNSLQIMCLLKF